jgi:hypothetical protein
MLFWQSRMPLGRSGRGGFTDDLAIGGFAIAVFEAINEHW